MIAVASLLLVIVLSLIVTRVGAVALRLTGMSNDAARFQARSALTGAGFTTNESEQILSHPVRRKIIGILMLLGNVGIVAASGTLIVSLTGIEGSHDAWRLAVLLGGVLVLYLFAASRWIDRVMCGVITWALSRFTDLETRDFATLLHLHGDFRIAEVLVEPADWMAGKSLQEIRAGHPGILVLGIIRPGEPYEGAPGGGFRAQPGQTLVIYGLPDSVEALDCHCGPEGHKGHVHD